MSKNIAYDKNGNILPKMAKLKIVTIAISALNYYTHNHTIKVKCLPHSLHSIGVTQLAMQDW